MGFMSTGIQLLRQNNKLKSSKKRSTFNRFGIDQRFTIITPPSDSRFSKIKDSEILLQRRKKLFIQLLIVVSIITPVIIWIINFLNTFSQDMNWVG